MGKADADAFVVTDTVLPAGDAARLGMTRTPQGQVIPDTSMCFLWSDLGGALILYSAQDAPEDRWLSIAETSECRPAEDQAGAGSTVRAVD